jgi:hypothetical protein
MESVEYETMKMDRDFWAKKYEELYQMKNPQFNTSKDIEIMELKNRIEELEKTNDFLVKRFEYLFFCLVNRKNLNDSLRKLKKDFLVAKVEC